jgi:hypothetical protein
MRFFVFLILGFLQIIEMSYAADFPFSDLTPGTEEYRAVETLSRNGMIVDDGSDRFRPGDPATRDIFTSVSASVSCTSCLTPSIEDIVSYRVSPFIDLAKSSPYYYCIADAATDRIVSGYSLDTSGQAVCQDGQTYTSPPFCGTNSITRIEAATILLRQVGLWDDARNT